MGMFTPAEINSSANYSQKHKDRVWKYFYTGVTQMTPPSGRLQVGSLEGNRPYQGRGLVCVTLLFLYS